MLDQTADDLRSTAKMDQLRHELVDDALHFVRHYILPIVFSRVLVMSILIIMGATWSYRQGRSDAQTSGAVIAMAALYVMADMLTIGFYRHASDPRQRPILHDFRSAWHAGGKARRDVIRAAVGALAITIPAAYFFASRSTTGPVLLGMTWRLTFYAAFLAIGVTGYKKYQRRKTKVN